MTDISRLTARDVMRTEVATLFADDTIDAALALFEDDRIGGAPVIDAGDRLLGVLTLSDLVRTERVERERAAERVGTVDLVEPADESDPDESDPGELIIDKADFSPEALGSERVGDWMTREVVTVTPDTPLAKACGVMVDQHIHRVFVAEGGKLLGVVSSFDVVRCVAETALEKEQVQ